MRVATTILAIIGGLTILVLLAWIAANSIGYNVYKDNTPHVAKSEKPIFTRAGVRRHARRLYMRAADVGHRSRN